MALRIDTKQGRQQLSLIVVIILITIGGAVWAFNSSSERATARAASTKAVDTQFAKNTAKTWKVIEKNVTSQGSSMTYEYVLASDQSRIVVRNTISMTDSSDIIVGDIVKISRTNNTYSFAYRDPNDPNAYYIERVKKE